MIVSVEEATKLIKMGKVVAIPTETVYGLAADCFNADAVKETFAVKGRPADNPLIVHISNLPQLSLIAANIPKDAKILARTFWPGPLTLILPKLSNVPDVVTGGLSTVAVRMPDHPVALSLIKKTGPLTAPSANRSGRPSPTKTQHVEDEFDSSIPVLEGGSSSIGIESTVLDLTKQPYTILRPGFVTPADIEKVLANSVIQKTVDKAALKGSPGTRYTHYKPSARVIQFAPTDMPDDKDAYYISHSVQFGDEYTSYYYDSDFASLARHLYDHFRTADHKGFKKIYIEQLPSDHIHSIIAPLKDRIKRASSY
jgi:L-threonylcarbamoyladenylate synthase